MTITSFPSIFSTADLRFLKRGYFPIIHSPPNFRACNCLSLLSLLIELGSQNEYLSSAYFASGSLPGSGTPRTEAIIPILRKLSLLVDKHPPTDGHIKMTMQRPHKGSDIQASMVQVERKGGGSSIYKTVLFQSRSPL